MNPLLIRFPSLLATLEQARRDREQFGRLLRDRPTDVRIRARKKAAEHDLRLTARTRWIVSTVAVAAFLTGTATILPDLDVQYVEARKDSVIVEVQDIPETRQMMRPPPPPRPAVPIETEDESVPEDVTIETTDLAFHDALVDLPPPPGVYTEPVEEDALEFWAVQEKPRILKQVPPSYPEVARRAGIEGSILVRVLISKEGSVLKAEILRGKEVFRVAALDAVKQYRFSPALQNDRPVAVWMALPIRFRLVS